MQTNIKFLLDYYSKYPEVYNKVSSRLWVQFGLKSAELALLCTFCVMEDRRENESKR